MKVSTGVDIIEVKRIKESIEKYGDIFINKIYTIEEIEYCIKSEFCKYERFAVRFAGKEAIYKALNITEEIDFDWKDICIYKKENGRPYVKLINNLDQYNEKIDNIDISLSHINETAVATVVINWK